MQLLSHLVRVRGLKHQKMGTRTLSKKSHLVRVRGLKHMTHADIEKKRIVAPCTGAWIETNLNIGEVTATGSHLVRVRGLKLKHSIASDILCVVAPCTGAWIETDNIVNKRIVDYVAPCTGAWIETSRFAIKFLLRPSHLVRVRGLKPDGAPKD